MSTPTFPPTLDPATDANLRAASALMDAILPVMHLPPEPVKVAELDPLMRDLATHYAGGDDGPIREPGDDVPSFGDVYGSHEQFAQQLDKDWNRLADLGLYDIAGDVQVAAQQISEMGEQIEVARDKVKELVDEIAALRYEIRRRNGGF